MIKNLFKIISLKRPIYRFTTVSLPPKLKENHEFQFHKLHELRNYFDNPSNQCNVIKLIRENQNQLTDELIFILTKAMIRMLVIFDKELEEVLLPVLLHYFKTMDRNHSYYYGKILKNLLELNFEDQEFYNSISGMFIAKNMHRYVLLDHLAEIYLEDGSKKRLSQEMTTQIRKELISGIKRLDHKTQIQIQSLEATGI